MNCVSTVCGTVILAVPIGSNAVFGFVFKDDFGTPIDLHDSEFIVRMVAKYPAIAFEYGTATTPDALYIEEDIPIIPVQGQSYIADRLMLALTPSVTRQIPTGALTNWEIERRKDGDQRNWGTGMFRGYGGLNPDVDGIEPLEPPASGATLLRFSLADDASQTFAVPAVASGSLVRVSTYPTISANGDWFADALVDAGAASIEVELGIVKNVTIQPAAVIGVSDPDGSLNVALDMPQTLIIRNRTGAAARGVVRVAT